MRYRLFLPLLILVLVPLLSGCEIEPPDKEPIITKWSVAVDFHICVESVLGGYVFKMQDSVADMLVDVRTYNCGQAFTAKVSLYRVRREYSLYLGTTFLGNEIDEIPPDLLKTPHDDPLDNPWVDPTEIFIRDGIIGTYQCGSGKSPGGITQLSFFFEPAWVPLHVEAWAYANTDTGFLEVTNRYIYLFRVIIEDGGGRTDTFEFHEECTLIPC